METTAKKIDWKRYDDARPKISVRIPKADKQALDAALERRGESVSDLLMGYLRPIITEGTPEGQRAHEIISAAVQASIAWNKAHANGGFGDTTAVADADGSPIVEEWHSPEIIVRPRMTKGGAKVLYHIVTQRAGMSRHDAIRKHVSFLMDAWTDTPDDQRDKLLRELSDPEKHRFIIAYSGFQHWTAFRAAHEMMFHQAMYQTRNVSTPDDADEWAFVHWATDHLTKLWTRRRRTKADIVTIHEGDPESWGIDFGHYPITDDVDNIRAWAGIWLNSYRTERDAGLDHEGAMSVAAGQRIRVRLMKIADE
ncbi:MAG: hypothetical protein FGM22_10315 [Burkholderiaceae bacterium]|nr:hypothetical protein [Burkholderiaceae bacterium]